MHDDSKLSHTGYSPEHFSPVANFAHRDTEQFCQLLVNHTSVFEHRCGFNEVSQLGSLWVTSDSLEQSIAQLVPSSLFFGTEFLTYGRHQWGFGIYYNLAAPARMIDKPPLNHSAQQSRQSCFSAIPSATVRCIVEFFDHLRDKVLRGRDTAVDHPVVVADKAECCHIQARHEGRPIDHFRVLRRSVRHNVSQRLKVTRSIGNRMALVFWSAGGQNSVATTDWD
jgi:hypothetical protein